VQGARVEPVPSSEFPTPAERPKKVVLDCSRARDTFGISIPGYADAFSRASHGSS
jgi:dTDP-4-dehydrorhamnose reductase